MKRHKLAALAIAGLMTLSAVGCGSSSQTTATTAAGTEAGQNETEAAETEAEETETEAAENEAASGERQELRVGMECAYAPFNWQETAATETNVPIENVPGAYAEGYDVQISRILADGVDRDLVIVKLSWDGLIDALNQGQIDAIIAGMMATPERKEAINFTEPYHETVYAMMVNEDSPYADATSIQDFSGASVLGQKDTALDTVIDQIEGVNHLTPVASIPDMLGRLQQGTCDALVINLENAAGYQASNPKFKVIAFDEGNGFTLETNGACVGLRKSDTELLDQMNEILATLDQETLDEMWNTALESQPQ